MINKDQISLLKRFIKSHEDTILINQINENITTLYLYFIRYFAEKNEVKINTETKVIDDDLFGVKQIQIFSITSQSKLKNALNMRDKKIIFTDYKKL